MKWNVLLFEIVLYNSCSWLIGSELGVDADSSVGRSLHASSQEEAHLSFVVREVY
jgi:hypothetical protein